MPKILIVDDEVHIRLLLQQTFEDLEDEGIELLTAENGFKAAEIIRKERPELVFLDVMMPEMNGYEVCKKVKKEWCLNGIFVIMLTAKGQEFDKKLGMEAGADLYMTKPFDPDMIITKTMEILKIN